MSNEAQTSKTTPHPLVKAADIEAAMGRKRHWLNRDAIFQAADISDMAGMTGLGVHLNRLPPGGESTAIHYQITMSEWIYILKGSGTLQLVDTTKHPNFAIEKSKGHNLFCQVSKSEIEEREVGVGDFIGFQAGPLSCKYGHGMKAGSEGIEYLIGGDRPDVDICCYPTYGKVKAIDDKENENDLMLHQEPSSEA